MNPFSRFTPDHVQPHPGFVVGSITCGLRNRLWTTHR